jgi:hypothetical protein
VDNALSVHGWKLFSFMQLPISWAKEADENGCERKMPGAIRFHLRNFFAGGRGVKGNQIYRFSHSDNE